MPTTTILPSVWMARAEPMSQGLKSVITRPVRAKPEVSGVPKVVSRSPFGRKRARAKSEIQWPPEVPPTTILPSVWMARAEPESGPRGVTLPVCAGPKLVSRSPGAASRECAELSAKSKTDRKTGRAQVLAIPVTRVVAGSMVWSTKSGEDSVSAGVIRPLAFWYGRPLGRTMGRISPGDDESSLYGSAKFQVQPDFRNEVSRRNF